MKKLKKFTDCPCFYCSTARAYARKKLSLRQMTPKCGHCKNVLKADLVDLLIWVLLHNGELPKEGTCSPHKGSGKSFKGLQTYGIAVLIGRREGRPFVDIADRLGISKTTAHKIYHIAAKVVQLDKAGLSLEEITEKITQSERVKDSKKEAFKNDIDRFLKKLHRLSV